MEFFLQPTFPTQRFRYKVWVDNNSFYFSPQPCRLLFGFELDRLVPEMWLSSFGSRFFQNAVMLLVAFIVSIEIDHLQRKTVETIIMTRFRGKGDVCLEIPSNLNFEFPHQVTILIRSGPIFYLQAVSCCEHPILVDESSATISKVNEECQLDSLFMTEQFLTVNHC